MFLLAEYSFVRHVIFIVGIFLLEITMFWDMILIVVAGDNCVLRYDIEDYISLLEITVL